MPQAVLSRKHPCETWCRNWNPSSKYLLSAGCGASSYNQYDDMSIAQYSQTWPLHTSTVGLEYRPSTATMGGQERCAKPTDRGVCRDCCISSLRTPRSIPRLSVCPSSRAGRYASRPTIRDQRQLLLPVDDNYSCRSWGETIWYRRYRIGHRSAGSATEAEANGRQESTSGGGSIWYERADGADVAARQAAVGEEGQAEVANPTGPVRRDMGQGGRAPSAERR